MAGAGTTLALKYGVATPLTSLLRGVAAAHPFVRAAIASWAPAVLGVAVWMASGWIVARTHRAQLVRAVAAYAVFVNVWEIPRAYSMMRHALDDPRFIPGLTTLGMEMATATIGIIVGAWVANLGRSRIPERVTPVL